MYADTQRLFAALRSDEDYAGAVLEHAAETLARRFGWTRSNRINGCCYALAGLLRKAHVGYSAPPVAPDAYGLAYRLYAGAYVSGLAPLAVLLFDYQPGLRWSSILFSAPSFTKRLRVLSCYEALHQKHLGFEHWPNVRHNCKRSRAGAHCYPSSVDRKRCPTVAAARF